MLTPEEQQFIRTNVPDALSDEQIAKAYYEHEGNIVNTIAHLLEIPVEVPKEKTEWEKRRELCDEMDRLAQSHIRRT
jgi:hypothetical protein